MTNNKSNRKPICKAQQKNSVTAALITLITLFATFALTLFFSDKISHSVKSGLSLCANVIIPSVFPFIILSDFLYFTIDFSSLKFFGDIFERIFKINRIGLYPFILGVLCGFPLGVKCASELYLDGKLTKDECERLIGFSNNTGPAFLVCGIGLGLRQNICEGFILYFVTVISAVLVGILFSIGKAASVGNFTVCQKKSFSVTESIKNAGINTLNICSYLTFFACTVGLLRNILGESLIYLSAIPFLEVGSASSILSKTKLLSGIQSLSMTAFAIGFSGFSVHLQSLSFISVTDIKVGRYFLMKLIQGVLSFIFTAILYSLLMS